MSIRPVVRLTERSREQFVGATRAGARRLAHAELETMGKAWEAEAGEIIQAELPRRDGARHKANTTHLENSLTHRVVEGGDQGFPMLLDLTIKPGVSAAKVAALNFGIDHEYEITAKNAKALRWGDAPGDLTQAGLKSVTWSPTGPNSKGIIANGYHFMERARDRVLARFGRRV